MHMHTGMIWDECHDNVTRPTNGRGIRRVIQVSRGGEIDDVLLARGREWVRGMADNGAEAESQTIRERDG